MIMLHRQILHLHTCAAESFNNSWDCICTYKNEKDPHHIRLRGITCGQETPQRKCCTYNWCDEFSSFELRVIKVDVVLEWKWMVSLCWEKPEKKSDSAVPTMLIAARNDIEKQKSVNQMWCKTSNPNVAFLLYSKKKKKNKSCFFLNMSQPETWHHYAWD